MDIYILERLGVDLPIRLATKSFNTLESVLVSANTVVALAEKDCRFRVSKFECERDNGKLFLRFVHDYEFTLFYDVNY